MSVVPHRLHLQTLQPHHLVLIAVMQSSPHHISYHLDPYPDATLTGFKHDTTITTTQHCPMTSTLPICVLLRNHLASQVQHYHPPPLILGNIPSSSPSFPVYQNSIVTSEPSPSQSTVFTIKLSTSLPPPSITSMGLSSTSTNPCCIHIIFSITTTIVSLLQACYPPQSTLVAIALASTW